VLKLSEALGAWTPGEGQGPADPVVLLGAAWGDIVGEENARNSHPSQVAGDTLTIVTTSSVWSQQLSYLSDGIVATIRARLPHAPVERVRFRVGKVPARGSHSSSKRVYRSESAAAQVRAPALDAREALERFKSSVDEAERAKRSLGWKDCRSCAALIAPGSGPLCTTCEIARGAERERLVSRLLFEAPWLGFAGTANLVEDLRQDEYESIRRRLLSRWWDRLCRVRLSGTLSRDGAERLIASSYVLLKSELAPERLTPAIVRNVLGDELFELIYETKK
jgi:hypothetical protein